MATFRVRKVLTYTYEAYVEAEDWEEAEEKARYNGDDIEWEDTTDYNCDEDIEAEEYDY